MADYPDTTPRGSVWAWSFSAILAAGGLGLAYGFEEPIIANADRVVRIMLAGSWGLFLLSRLMMLFPLVAMGPRLRRYWVDYVLIASAGVWWGLDRSAEPIVLRIAAIYCLATGLGALARGGMTALAMGFVYRSAGSAVSRLIVGAVILTLVGAVILSLPICWQGAYPVQTDHPLMRYQLGMHWLDCLFTSTAAITGTGLSVCDIGYQFSRVGQIVILSLMQVGGLAVLITGAVLGWRFRQVIGWGGPDDDISPIGVGRLIRFVCVVAVMIELAGAGVLWSMWEPAVGDGDIGSRLLASVFHSVSAFCNNGLVLGSDSMVAYRGFWGLYAAILPLMVLGGLGGPVLYELLHRLTYRGGWGPRSLSRDSVVTLIATVLLIAAGAGLLVGIESSKACQLRYPRAATPGRLNIDTSPASLPATQFADSAVTTFSAEGSAKVNAERLATMSPSGRWLAGVFHSVASRSGGMRTVRLDESSISPASRVVLMGCMLVGGGVGGSAGGLRIVVVAVLLGAVLLNTTRPRESTCGALASTRQWGIATAGALVMAMIALIGLTTLVLAYREAGSLGACLFEAVSACCNVGFSTGLTQQLSVHGKVAVVLAMLLGRLIPLAILLRCVRWSALAPPMVDTTPRDTGSIPLE